MMNRLAYERLKMAEDAQSWFPALVADAAAAFHATPEEVMGRGRWLEVARARHVVAWVLREADLSLPSIGALLGRDHSTILSAIRRVDSDPELLATAWGLADRYARTPERTTT